MKRGRSNDEAELSHHHAGAPLASKDGSLHSIIGDVYGSVTSTWMRMGYSEGERENKWRTFVDNSLKPFLSDFETISKTEEHRLVLENKELLRSVLTFALRLEVAPSIAELTATYTKLLQQEGDEEALALAATSIDGAGPCAATAAASAFSIPKSIHLDGNTLEALTTADAFKEFDARSSGPEGGPFSQYSHHHVRELLEKEKLRLEEIAEHRLGLLRALYIAKKALSLSPEEQTRWRQYYSAEAFSEQPDCRTKWTPPPPYCPAAQSTEAGPKAESAPGRRSSCFSQARSDEGRKPSSPSSNSSTSRHDSDELRLLMDTDSVNLLLVNRETTCFLRSRTTFEPKSLHPKAEDAPPLKGKPDEEEQGRRETKRPLAVPPPPPPPPPCDTSCVDQYGLQQNLSLHRISAEASAIFDQMVRTNRDMETQTETELDALRAVLRGSTPCTLAEEGAVLLSGVEAEVSRLRRQYDAEAAAFQARAAAGDSAVPVGVQRVLSAPTYSPILAYVQHVRKGVQTKTLLSLVLEFKKQFAALLSAHRRLGKPATHGLKQKQCPTTRFFFAQSGDDALPEKLIFLLEEDDSGCRRREVDAAVLEGLSLSAAEIVLSVNAFNSALLFLHELVEDATQRVAIVDSCRDLMQRLISIEEEKRVLQENSRERLLSRKVNMAKQLLEEEKVRKRLATEVPKLRAGLQAALGSWRELQRRAGEHASQQPELGLTLIVDGVDVDRFLAENTKGGGAGGGVSAVPSRQQSLARARPGLHASRPQLANTNKPNIPTSTPQLHRKVALKSQPAPTKMTAKKHNAGGSVFDRLTRKENKPSGSH